MNSLKRRNQRREYRDWLRSQDPRCLYCGRYLRSKGVTLDHVIPVSRGGTHDPDNLALACPLCNAAKRERTPLEWLADLQRACDLLARREVISPEITAASDSISPEMKFLPPPHPSESKDA
jgi:CRISPR/Cas system Type II protein with McrA/HNH and RuvC-like nuclease domain